MYSDEDDSESYNLDQMDRFIKTMIDIGIRPEGVVPTIAEIFFSGDIDNVSWLNEVLTEIAKGYVAPHQANLMLSWWAWTRGLAYEGSFWNEENGHKADEELRPGRPTDLGSGWRVGKDKRGDWIPLPGGPMTYKEALEHANIRAFISNYRHL